MTEENRAPTQTPPAKVTPMNRIEAYVVVATVFIFGVIGLAYLPQAISVGPSPSNWIAWRSDLQDKLTEVLPHNDAAKTTFGFIEFDLLRQGSEGVFVGTDMTLFTNQDLPTFRTDALDIEADLLNFIEASRDRLAAQGSDLLVVLLPDKRRILPDQFPHPIPDWVRERYNRIHAALEANDIEVVRALEVLKPLGADAFMRNDTHWTLKGADMTAGLVGQRIRQLHPNLVDTNPYERDDVDLEVLDWSGDMRSFVPLTQERLERVFPAEVIARPYIAPLDFNSEIPEITVVGTSYTGFRNAEVDDPWLFTDILSHAIGADIYLCSDWGEDVEEPFRSYFDGVEQGHMPAPSLVVWEIPERFFGYKVPRTDVMTSGSLFETSDDLTCG